MLKANDIAERIIQVANHEYGTGKCLFWINDYYLNELLYFLDAIHLIKYQSSLFDKSSSRFQKMNHGPILPSIYNYYSRFQGKKINTVGNDASYAWDTLDPDSDSKQSNHHHNGPTAKSVAPAGKGMIDLMNMAMTQPAVDTVDSDVNDGLNDDVPFSDDSDTAYASDSSDNYYSDNVDDKTSDFINKYLPKLLKFSPFELQRLAKSEPQYKDTNKQSFNILNPKDLQTKSDFRNPRTDMEENPNKDYWSTFIDAPSTDSSKTLEVVPIPDAEANYNDRKTAMYWKQHEFWNQKHDNKVIDKVENELLDKKNKLPKYLKSYIDEVLNDGTAIVINDFSNKPKKISFKVYNLNSDSDKAQSFKAYHDVYNNYDVLQNTDKKNQNVWLGKNVLNAILGSHVLSNQKLCKLHNGTVQRTDEQNWEIGQLNHDKKNKPLKFYYMASSVYFLMMGKYTLGKAMFLDGKKGYGLKYDWEKVIAKAINLKPSECIKSNDQVASIAQIYQLIKHHYDKEQLKFTLQKPFKITKRTPEHDQEPEDDEF